METATEIKQDEEVCMDWSGEVPLVERDSLPDEAGLYCVFAGDEALYVGRTTSLLLRWRNHEQLSQFVEIEEAGEQPVTIGWIVARKGRRFTARGEQLMINQFNPTMNSATAHKAAVKQDSIKKPGSFFITEDRALWLREEQFRRIKAGRSSRERTLSAIVCDAIDALARQEAIDAYIKKEG